MTEPRHEPATCDQPAETCKHCDGFNIGYTVGKEKARQEIIYRLGETHLVSCGCDPCNVLRAVIDALVGRQVFCRGPNSAGGDGSARHC